MAADVVTLQLSSDITSDIISNSAKCLLQSLFFYVLIIHLRSEQFRQLKQTTNRTCLTASSLTLQFQLSSTFSHGHRCVPIDQCNMNTHVSHYHRGSSTEYIELLDKGISFKTMPLIKLIVFLNASGVKATIYD